MAMRSRLKMAPHGWAYQARGIEFETSKLSSLVNNDKDGVDIGDVTLKFYNSSDTELTTQTDLDSSCVKTVIEFEPTHDYEVIGGFISMVGTTTQDIRVYCIAVPDIPAAAGGSKVMINQLNMKYIGESDRLIIDGRTPKRMNYDATYHTNKLRKEFHHPAGAKCEFTIVFEIFRP